MVTPYHLNIVEANDIYPLNDGTCTQFARHCRLLCFTALKSIVNRSRHSQR